MASYSLSVHYTGQEPSAQHAKYQRTFVTHKIGFRLDLLENHHSYHTTLNHQFLSVNWFWVSYTPIGKTFTDFSPSSSPGRLLSYFQPCLSKLSPLLEHKHYMISSLTIGTINSTCIHGVQEYCRWHHTVREANVNQLHVNSTLHRCTFSQASTLK